MRDLAERKRGEVGDAFAQAELDEALKGLVGLSTNSVLAVLRKLPIPRTGAVSEVSATAECREAW